MLHQIMFGYKNPPGGKNEPTTDSNWATDSIEYLDELVSEHGPFFGILGYSQGAAFYTRVPRKYNKYI